MEVKAVLRACMHAPNLEAFKKFREEPEAWALGAYDTSEIKLAISLEEAMQILKHAT